MLVWNAMPSITPMMSTTRLELSLMPRIVSTTSSTTSPPLRATVLAPSASWLADNAFSAFSRTVAPSCSIDDAACCSADACSSARTLKSWAPCEICDEAVATLSEFERTLPTTLPEAALHGAEGLHQLSDLVASGDAHRVVHRARDAAAEPYPDDGAGGARDQHQHDAHQRRAVRLGGRPGRHRCALGRDPGAGLREQARGFAVHAGDRVVTGRGIASGVLEGVEALAVVDAHLDVRGAELLHQGEAVARRQRREQRLGLDLDGVLLLGERAPMLLEPGCILAAQRRVLPFLELRLEGDQHVGNGALARLLGTDVEFVHGHRLVQAVDADQGRGHQGGQDAC